MRDNKIYKKMYQELSDSVEKALEYINENPELAELMLEAALLDCRNFHINADSKRRRERQRN